MKIFYDFTKKHDFFNSLVYFKHLCVLTTLTLCVLSTHFLVWPKK